MKVHHALWGLTTWTKMPKTWKMELVTLVTVCDIIWLCIVCIVCIVMGKRKPLKSFLTLSRLPQSCTQHRAGAASCAGGLVVGCGWTGGAPQSSQWKDVERCGKILDSKIANSSCSNDFWFWCHWFWVSLSNLRCRFRGRNVPSEKCGLAHTRLWRTIRKSLRNSLGRSHPKVLGDAEKQPGSHVNYGNIC